MPADYKSIPFKWKYTLLSATIVHVTLLIVSQITIIYEVDWFQFVDIDRFIWLFPPNIVQYQTIMNSAHSEFEKVSFFRLNIIAVATWLVWLVGDVVVTVKSSNKWFIHELVYVAFIFMALSAANSVTNMNKIVSFFGVSVNNSMEYIMLYYLFFISAFLFMSSVVIDCAIIYFRNPK